MTLLERYGGEVAGLVSAEAVEDEALADSRRLKKDFFFLDLIHSSNVSEAKNSSQ
jgi:hypothetical protein